MKLEEEALRVFKHFGTDTQERKLVEEVFEFLKELILYEAGVGDINKVIEEYDDVELLMLEFKQYLEITDEEKYDGMKYKVGRTLERYKIE